MRPFPIAVLAGLLAGPMAAVAADGPPRRVQIEYENLATGQVMSTSAFVAHKPGVHLWAAGKPAELPLRMMAEEGNPEWILGTAVLTPGHVFGDAAAAIPEPPGVKRHLELTVTPENPEVSGAMMIGQTNDGFVGVDAVRVYDLDKPLTLDLLPMQAGTVVHHEDKTFLRALGGLGREARDGVVGPHTGLQPGSEVPADWRFDPKQPIVRVTITPVAAPNG